MLSLDASNITQNKNKYAELLEHISIELLEVRRDNITLNTVNERTI